MRRPPSEPQDIDFDENAALVADRCMWCGNTISPGETMLCDECLDRFGEYDE